MREKAVLQAKATYAELLAEVGGDETALTQPWAKTKKRMRVNPDTRNLVPHLPKNLGRAIRSKRKPRKIIGRPRKLAPA